MNKKPKNIEQLYSESFNDFRVEPSSGLWKSISTKLAWRNFFTFNPTTINAYYIAGLLALTTAGVLLLTKPTIENNQEAKETTINNTIENSVITPMQENKAEPKEVIIPEESRKVEAGSRKAEGSGQKAVGKKQLAKGSIQKIDSGINDRLPSTQKLAPRTQYPVPSTRELVTPELATPHPKPHTQNPPSTQDPEPSTMSPDPWPNIDSLFTNNTPPPPEYTIEFPNAFTPNSNGPTNGYYTPGSPNNDVFYPVYKGVVEYHLSIYNRRGELIFESNEINIGWDGYINDRLAAQGVYVWKAKGKYSNGENFVKLGNIMLIKK